MRTFKIDNEDDKVYSKFFGNLYTVNYGHAFDLFEPKFSTSVVISESKDEEYEVELPELKAITDDIFVCCIRPDGVVEFLHNLVITEKSNGMIVASFKISN